MTTIGLFEAKNRLSELVGRASEGEEVVITRRGQPAARIVPYLALDDADVRRQRIEASIERIAQIRKTLRHKISRDALLAGRHDDHRY